MRFSICGHWLKAVHGINGESGVTLAGNDLAHLKTSVEVSFGGAVSSGQGEPLQRDNHSGTAELDTEQRPPGYLQELAMTSEAVSLPKCNDWIFALILFRN